MNDTIVLPVVVVLEIIPIKIHFTQMLRFIFNIPQLTIVI